MDRKGQEAEKSAYPTTENMKQHLIQTVILLLHLQQPFAEPLQVIERLNHLQAHHLVLHLIPIYVGCQQAAIQSPRHLHVFSPDQITQ